MEVVKITCFVLKIDSFLFRPMITNKCSTLKNICYELMYKYKYGFGFTIAFFI